MSNQELTSFLRACGGAGALEIAVDGPGQPDAGPQRFHRPSLLIGRHERADLRLGDPAVSQRHAYLQLIAGRLLCIDLESRTGTLHRGEPVSFTWLDPTDTIQIGPYRLSLRLGPTGGGLATEAVAPPVGMEQWKSALKKADLEIRRDDRPTTLWPMPQMIAMVGGSPLCHLRLVGERVTRFAFSLVRTPVGVWLVDLGSTTGIRVNDQPRLLALLAEGDEIPIGPYRLVMRYGGRPEPSDLVVPAAGPPTAASHRHTAVPGVFRAPQGPPATTTYRPEESLLPAVQGLLEQVVQVQQQMSEQLPQAIAMITQAFGSLQREQMSVVRDELAEIRRLNQEILALRVAGAASGGTPAAANAAPAPAPAPSAPSPDRPAESQLPPAPTIAPEPDPESRSEPRTPQPRFEPAQVGSFVDAQLARVERERRSRWRKLLRAMLSS